MATTEPLSFILGETWVIDFTVEGTDGQVLDLTAADVRLRLKRRGVLMAEVTNGVDAGIVIAAPATGAGVATVTPSIQAGFVAGVYEHELRVVFGDGSKSTQLLGALTAGRSLFPAP